MTSNERIRALTITLIVAAALATACGGGNGGGNNTTNNESNNTTNNATTNNDTGTDNNDTGTDNNDTDSNNDPGSNNTTFEGAVTFVAPTETEVFTNGDLALTIAVDGAADEVELVLDGADVLHAFDGGTEFVWDTTSVDDQCAVAPRSTGRSATVNAPRTCRVTAASPAECMRVSHGDETTMCVTSSSRSPVRECTIWYVYVMALLSYANVSRRCMVALPAPESGQSRQSADSPPLISKPSAMTPVTSVPLRRTVPVAMSTLSVDPTFSGPGTSNVRPLPLI